MKKYKLSATTVRSYILEILELAGISAEAGIKIKRDVVNCYPTMQVVVQLTDKNELLQLSLHYDNSASELILISCAYMDAHTSLVKKHHCTMQDFSPQSVASGLHTILRLVDARYAEVILKHEYTSYVKQLFSRCYISFVGCGKGNIAQEGYEIRGTLPNGESCRVMISSMVTLIKISVFFGYAVPHGLELCCQLSGRDISYDADVINSHIMS